MSKYIAITSASKALDFGYLKQASLLFDKILIVGFYGHLKRLRKLSEYDDDLYKIRNEFIDLMDKGLVDDSRTIFDGIDAFIEREKIYHLIQKLAEDKYPSIFNEIRSLQSIGDNIDKFMKTLDGYTGIVTGLECRELAVKLREKEEFDAAVLYTPFQLKTLKSEKSKDMVARVILKSFPYPNENVPWESIIEYRSDNDAMRNFLRLKNWINEIGNTNISIQEFDDKFRYLLSEYEHQMKIHKIATKTSYFETIVTVSSEMAENLLKFKFGKMTKTIFDLKRQQIDLLEAENKALGREIAYIFNAKKYLNNYEK